MSLRHSFTKQAIAALAAIAFFMPLKSVFADDSSLSEQTVSEHIVVIEGSDFVTKTRQVKVGDTITWINKDIVPHAATADDRSWDTGLIKSGDKASITVSKDMVTDYFCDYHPTMVASIIVTSIEIE